MHFICTYSQYCSKLSPLPTFLCRFFLSIWQISMRSIIGYVNQQGWPSWKYIVCQRKALYPCFLQWFSIHLVVRLCYSLESLKLSNLNENIYCSTKTIKSIPQSWILIGGRFSGLTTPLLYEKRWWITLICYLVWRDGGVAIPPPSVY